MITETEKNILENGLNQIHFNQSVYEVLAKHGEMERTSNGFKSIDPRTISERCKKLINQYLNK
jgi:hypothetical protein